MVSGIEENMVGSQGTRIIDECIMVVTPELDILVGGGPGISELVLVEIGGTCPELVARMPDNCVSRCSQCDTQLCTVHSATHNCDRAFLSSTGRDTSGCHSLLSTPVSSALVH